MNKPIIRPATERDIDAIIPLWREMMDLHQQVEPVVWTMGDGADDAFRRYLAECLADNSHLVVVAESKGRVIGFVHGAIGGRPPVLETRAEGLIHGICVAAAARRRGIGGRLVSEALEWFRAQGMHKARAGWAINNPLSGPFWVAQGFRPYLMTGVCEMLRPG